MTCAVEGCGRHRKYRELCGTHYERRRVTGSVQLRQLEPRSCIVENCKNTVLSRDLCGLHYGRWRRTGTTEATDQPVALRLRNGAAIDTHGCWIWQGSEGVNGYGRISIRDQVQYAHRVSYETFIGPIPDGLTIDHLCRVRMCINPDHLEPVTRSENTRRELTVRYSHD